MTIMTSAEERHALDLDAADPLPARRFEFCIPPYDGDPGGEAAYFAGNSLGLQPRGLRDRLPEFLDDWARLGVEGHLEADRPWYSYHELLRGPAARLVGARETEVVVMNSLTVNLYGTPQHRRVVTETGPLVTTGPVPEQIVKDPELLVGKRIVDEQGSPPRSTIVNRKVYDENGKLLYDSTWYSSYSGEKSVIHVGTKKKPKPKPVSDSGMIVSTSLKPSLNMSFVPERVMVTDAEALVQFEVVLNNHGAAPARDVLVEAILVTASAAQDQQIAGFFEQPNGEGDRIAISPPMGKVSLKSVVRLPLAQVNKFEMEGRVLFVPLVAFNLLFRGGGSNGQASASYLVGRGKPEDDKLGPIRLDFGARQFRDVVARLHSTGLTPVA